MAVITHFEKRCIHRTRPLLESFVPNNFVSNLTMTCHSVLRDRVRAKSPRQVVKVVDSHNMINLQVPSPSRSRPIANGRQFTG